MPSAIFPCSSPPPPKKNGITKLTNCRLVRGDSLVWDDVWVSPVTGKILRSQTAFYDELMLPDQTIDLGGRIVSPGFIECQLNGAFGFNFSTVLEDMSQYGKSVRDLNKRLVTTGVTSYIPTVTSQTSDLYHKVLPYLGPSGHSRSSDDGAESLGAHVEGPFLNPAKNGVHNRAVLREARSFGDLEDMYGWSCNINPPPGGPTVKMITVAPELGSSMTPTIIPELVSRGVIVSIGHSEATYEEASAAVAAGATMITHLFNAMRPLHHRNPGIFGVLGGIARPPFFGVIADGIHLHPTTIKIAWNAHPEGFILVTDAMHMVGLADGVYEWTNGEGEHFIVKKGSVLHLQGSDTIAGSSITLIECVNNFLNWSGATVPQAIKAVTATPAAMLGVQGIKGCLDAGADADLVILSESERKEGEGVGGKMRELVVDEVWKFGARVFQRE
ncbi:putative N-acetylglucosamine-6-phosphate deacetylase [Diplogelasinospora grovesii]|uniref:N-acetylglucosamine-6-phosphate deacetylase n=1 Tax=Diplogelasinospora grovesii TaxID=303347 RepID=A0AAN6NHE3_9PEZI|nr:putative N-acetylglucosamine-6-phosphate deacetylase [Diplogelasinospora grovesii]